jgi:hypothetical protein
MAGVATHACNPRPTTHVVAARYEKTCLAQNRPDGSSSCGRQLDDSRPQPWRRRTAIGNRRIRSSAIGGCVLGARAQARRRPAAHAAVEPRRERGPVERRRAARGGRERETGRAALGVARVGRQMVCSASRPQPGSPKGNFMSPFLGKFLQRRIGGNGVCGQSVSQLVSLPRPYHGPAGPTATDAHEHARVWAHRESKRTRVQ